MQASQTQIDALLSVDRSEAKRRILDVFANDQTVTFTRREIAARANVEVPTVCGRVNEMVKDEILAERGTTKRPGRRCREGLVGLPVSVN
ncbi:hypothetical protein [Caballeronia sp. AZ7_KS35]|uniref:hypothetical protein n=1 Tax=Caballeronia sp. AZ7_KS35 TaxID=2921762 RepID=UPI0020295EA6|nr:hypothetical protein [Caballeronia sp. AZ7_KS35]